MTTDESQAAQLIAHHMDEMISVIIRHGDIADDKSFSTAPGETCAIYPLKNGDVVATITAVNPKPYAEILKAEWAKAGCRTGNEFERRQEIDPDLKSSDIATVIELDLNSLRYEPR